MYESICIHGTYRIVRNPGPKAEYYRPDGVVWRGSTKAKADAMAKKLNKESVK